jgi:uncharacterized protein (TIRG00374 family)
LFSGRELLLREPSGHCILMGKEYMKRRLRLLGGIAVSLVFLYLAMRDIQWDELWRLFQTASYLYLIPALIVIVAINWFRAYRWRLLMHPDDHVPLARIFWIVNIGYLFNNILPAKAGEVVRGYLIGREIAGGLGQAVSTLLIERLLDVLAVVVILVGLIPFVDVAPWLAQGGLLFGAAAIVGTVALLVLARYGDRGVDWLWRIVGRLPLVGDIRLKRALHNLMGGLRVLGVRGILPRVIASSIVVWAGYGATSYLFLAVFRMTDLPISAALLVLCATGFGMMVPALPGGMGVYEWAAVQALAMYGVGQSAAFGYALGMHVFTIVVLNLLGLTGMIVEGLSYGAIRSEAIETPVMTGADAGGSGGS